MSWDSFAVPSPAPLPAAALGLCSLSSVRASPPGSKDCSSFLSVRDGPALRRASLADHSAVWISGRWLSSAPHYSPSYSLGFQRPSFQSFFFLFKSLQTSSLDHLLDITAMTRPFPGLDTSIQELPGWETSSGHSNECKHSNICYLHDRPVSLDLSWICFLLNFLFLFI